MLCLVAERHDISKIPLIAGSTVHPGMLELFDDVTVYFRRGLASYHLFSPGEWSRLANCTPTVTNAGTVFAMEVGCKDIYLFGGTLRNNLTAGRDRTDQQIWMALEQVDAAKFVKNMGGLDTESTEAESSLAPALLTHR